MIPAAGFFGTLTGVEPSTSLGFLPGLPLTGGVAASSDPAGSPSFCFRARFRPESTSSFSVQRKMYFPVTAASGQSPLCSITSFRTSWKKRFQMFKRLKPTTQNLKYCGESKEHRKPKRRGRAVAEWSKVLQLKKYKRHPKDPKLTPRPKQRSLKAGSHAYVITKGAKVRKL